MEQTSVELKESDNIDTTEEMSDCSDNEGGEWTTAQKIESWEIAFRNYWEKFSAWVKEGTYNTLDIAKIVKEKGKTNRDVITLFEENSGKIIYFADIQSDSNRKKFSMFVVNQFEDKGLFTSDEADQMFGFIETCDKVKLNQFLHCLVDIAQSVVFLDKVLPADNDDKNPKE